MSQVMPSQPIGTSTGELMSRYVMGNYARFPIAFAHGEGSWIWDEAGKRYLDFGAGIAVCSIGHCHPAIREALHEQGSTLIHCSNLYQNRRQAELAEFIVERVMRSPGRVFFCNSGAEANDSLIKLARKFGHDSAATAGRDRYGMVTCTNSFHGRTLGGIAATGQDKVKKGFEPLLEGFSHVPFNDCEALRAAVGPETAAILFEVVQGEGGIHVATPEFLKTAAELREEHGILVMLDEVQCGFGRTGDWNGWETALRGQDWDFEPDAVSWAKGMGGGFAIGGIWASERTAPGGAE
ncbi:MAG: aminotransferase class III-fold pyridoxal phosphate-dependent enzyme, partial [Verrucomicrobiae bacterium]|nr:aminotransferase class III-fold pyridoxal phosphate-dependent enzyme [Verrucomicrobiae bacterium]